MEVQILLPTIIIPIIITRFLKTTRNRRSLTLTSQTTTPLCITTTGKPYNNRSCPRGFTISVAGCFPTRFKFRPPTSFPVNIDAFISLYRPMSPTGWCSLSTGRCVIINLTLRSDTLKFEKPTSYLPLRTIPRSFPLARSRRLERKQPPGIATH